MDVASTYAQRVGALRRLGIRIPAARLAHYRGIFIDGQITTADAYSTADWPNFVAQLSQNPCCA